VKTITTILKLHNLFKINIIQTASISLAHTVVTNVSAKNTKKWCHNMSD